MIIISNRNMQAYSSINSILSRQNSSYQQFQTQMKSLQIEKETYLNLFLTTVVCRKVNNPEFNKYIDLLINFKLITGKKSADINYIGYKDRKSILMHACEHGSQGNIEHLLSIPHLNNNSIDPNGKNALFYAVKNPNQLNSNSIINLLLDAHPIFIHTVAEDNFSILFEAVEAKKYSTIQLLLKRGADVNLRLNQSRNTVSHHILNGYRQNKQTTVRILLLFLSYNANFHITNKSQKSVFDAAIDVDLNLTECAERFKHLDKESLLGLGDDYDYDKQSLTTLNQQTKKGDNASELQDVESNICSQKVDFSQVDFQQEDEDQDRIKSNKQIQNSFSSEQQQQQQQNEKRQLNFDFFSKEISQFSMNCEQRQRSVWINLHPFLSSLQKLANKHNLVLQVVGSFATGLWSNSSDIDINLIPKENEYVNFEAILQKIYKALKHKKNEYGIDDIFFNKNKINTIKLGLNSKYDNTIVDIAIFYRNNQNRAYVTYILESINTYPQIKPLFFAYKKICQTFDLHDHLVGGIKTYTLFLMIYSIVKNLSSQNLGELFNQISLYYGFCYQYQFQYDQIQVSRLILNKNQDIQNFPRPVFNFIDPLNPKNNVGGKNTRVQEVQNMFKSLYFTLHQLESSPYLHQLFELHSIF